VAEKNHDSSGKRQSVISGIKEHGVGMQTRLLTYWFLIILATMCAILLILNINGAISPVSQSVSRSLSVELDNKYNGISEYLSTLTAQCIRMSESSGMEIGNKLVKYGLTVKQLNNRPDLLLETEKVLYDPVNTALQVADCSGSFVVIDATTNTAAEHADTSRSGLYLRFANVAVGNKLNRDVFCFRGIPDIAREKGLQLHNRWNLEFDVSLLPGYAAALQKKAGRLADSRYLTGKVHLKDTWEDAALLCVPVITGDGKPCGICGAEISSLYFRLSHPSGKIQSGPVVTVIAPAENGRLLLSSGLIGGAEGTYLSNSEDLSVREGKYFNIYTGSSGSYIGQERKLSVSDAAGRQWVAAVLMPKDNYDAAEARNRRMWLVLILGALAILVMLSFILSRRFVSPISKSLRAIQDEKLKETDRTGISEIDALLSFIQSKEKDQLIERNMLPPDISRLFNTFSDRVKTLTTAEHSILNYYIEGHEISEIPDLACISMSTVRKHNRSIYEKLGVSSIDELMLYIDLFRRCGRLSELN
jgi:DNA-binding CsgD family transcriptional regulator